MEVKTSNEQPRQHWLSATQVAEKTSLCHEYVTRLIRQGHIKAVKVGRVWRVRNSDLQDFIAEKERPLTAEG
jgi:excisionase family DNA binding protein